MGCLHAATHLFCAAAIAVFIEYIFLLLVVYGNLDTGGLHLQWDKFTTRFPAGAATVDLLGNLTLQVVPSVLRARWWSSPPSLPPPSPPPSLLPP